MHLMPAPEDIPKKWWRGHTEWNALASAWFFKGVDPEASFLMKPGVNGETAYRHIRAILGSYQPRHEHKEAAVAYLCSMWMDGALLHGHAYGAGVPGAQVRSNH
jgi:hypothetical protein